MARVVHSRTKSTDICNCMTLVSCARVFFSVLKLKWVKIHSVFCYDKVNRPNQLIGENQHRTQKLKEELVENNPQDKEKNQL